MRVSGVSFKGIYGTATTMDGKKVKINLDGDNSTLMAMNHSKGSNGNTQIHLWGLDNNNGEESFCYSDFLCKDISIEKVTAGSKVDFKFFNTTGDAIKIGTLMDKASLDLYGSTAIVDEIVGKDVSIKVEDLDSLHSGVKVNKNSPDGFQLEGVVEDGNVNVKNDGIKYRYDA